MIGDGLSGALVAAALLRQGAEVILIGENGRPGRGTAYTAGADIHQANGPASALSADPADPDHFSRWLEERYAGGPIPGAGLRRGRRMSLCRAGFTGIMPLRSWRRQPGMVA